jgi:hypothetical protein
VALPVANEEGGWQEKLALFQIERYFPDLHYYMQRAKRKYPDRGSGHKALLKSEVSNGHLQKIPVYTLEAVMEEVQEKMSEENES